MAQRNRILDYMVSHKGITQREAIYLGCYRLSARVFDMRAEKIPVQTEIIEVPSTDGSIARIAFYYLPDWYKEQYKKEQKK